jgi:hypothetical protein
VDERIAEWDVAQGRDFAEDVRERARMAGKKLPYKAPLEFPKRPRGRPRKQGLDESAS